MRGIPGRSRSCPALMAEALAPGDEAPTSLGIIKAGPCIPVYMDTHDNLKEDTTGSTTLHPDAMRHRIIHTL